MVTDAKLRCLLAAARAARKQIARDRRTLVESYSSPPGRLSAKSVTDPVGLEWIAEHDAVLAKLKAAIAKAAGSAA